MRQNSTTDDAILTFARSWYGYGGGSDEDIYVHFGLPARSYFQRLTALLEGPTGEAVDESTRNKMLVVCARRLR